MTKLTTSEFITKSITVHGDRYGYSKTKYVRSLDKVIIICKNHGEFQQTPQHHLRGSGCPSCYGNNNKNTEQFIIDANKIHNFKYDYSKVKYKNTRDKVIITCKIHGDFQQTPNAHLTAKSSCPRCCNNIKHTNESFIEKAISIHGNKYDYSKINYINNSIKLIIICPIHGEFSQSAKGHINSKNGCPKCKTSKGELLIKSILEQNNIKFEEQKKFENCKNKRLLPFDFYLPNHNTLIEFDGEQHFKSVKSWGGKQGLTQIQLHDSIKNQFAIDNNIKLIRFKYNDTIEFITETINNIL